jgi:predicted membrane protein
MAKIRDVAVFLVVSSVVSFVLSLGYAIPFMLGLGVLHAAISAVPALGYWSAVLLMWAVTAILMFYRHPVMEEKDLTPKG